MIVVGDESVSLLSVAPGGRGSFALGEVLLSARGGHLSC
jgi:hypothetical protein